MDLSGLLNLKKLFNSTIDLLLEEIKEQYESKVEELNELIITSSDLLRQRDKKIEGLEAILKEKTFNEENYNRVSIIQNLNKQIRHLSLFLFGAYQIRVLVNNTAYVCLTLAYLCVYQVLKVLF